MWKYEVENMIGYYRIVKVLYNRFNGIGEKKEHVCIFDDYDEARDEKDRLNAQVLD